MTPRLDTIDFREHTSSPERLPSVSEIAAHLAESTCVGPPSEEALARGCWGCRHRDYAFEVWATGDGLYELARFTPRPGRHMEQARSAAPMSYAALLDALHAFRVPSSTPWCFVGSTLASPNPTLL